MRIFFVFALPMAIVWMGITNQISIENFIVGYVLGFFAIMLTQPRTMRVSGGRLPGQTLALVIYISLLFRDIFLSGIDVARRVLSPGLPVNPGVVAVPTQDPRRSHTITALSAIVITLTPGELVVEIKDQKTMYVHSLDVDLTATTGEQVQARRLKLLNRILGDQR
jgi:multicomponent Na+:H+ antiporter subunit E